MIKVERVETGPREKRPRSGCWRQFVHPVVDRHPASVVSVWVNGDLRVISAIEDAEYQDGQGTGPQWHLSVSVNGLRRRARKHEVKQLLRDFGMEGAEEDNHHPGVARHFWVPLDPEHRVECQCKIDEETIVEPDRYAWTNPRHATEAKCRGCEFFHLTGRRCPIHHTKGGPMATKAQGDDCYTKAKPDEPLFTLLGRDYSAPATVDFWEAGNRWMRKRIDEGAPPAQAAAELRQKVQEMFPQITLIQLDAADPLIGKFAEAAECADEMERWPEKKLAD